MNANGADENRVALISGAGKGVGAGIARAFAFAGIKVCMGYRSSESLAHETLDNILSKGGDAYLYKADVSDREQVRAMVADCVNRYGRLDILVNNAAMQPNLYIDEYTYETLADIWEINIGGYWRLAQEALPHLKLSPEARIINISSIHSKRPTVFDAGYAMTKGAIRMFTRELAVELMKYDIPVNSIELGACEIEYKTGNAPFRLQFPAVCNPGATLGRRVKPDDVGALALFLAGSAGRTLVGDGIRQDKGSMLL